MKERHLKLIMELIFIFIIPLLLICGTSTIEKTYVYDNSGNYQTSKTELSFDNSIIKYTKNPLYTNYLNFNQLININENESYNKINSYQINISNGFNTTAYFYLFNYNFTINHKYYYSIYSDIQSYRTGNSNVFPYISQEDLNNGYKTILTANSNELSRIIIVNTNIDNSTSSNIYIQLIDLTEMFGNGYEPATIQDLNNYINLTNYYEYTENEIIEYESNNIIAENYIINYTIWGKIKQLLVDNLDLNDSILLDLIICYTIIWFIMFIIWHMLYLFFDMLIHIGVDWGHREREKVSK